MGRHVDDMRATDQPYVRTTDDWAYGERAYYRTAEKLETELTERGMLYRIYGAIV